MSVPTPSDRVDEAMRRLDFKPSIAARILSGAKSNQIALIYDNHSPYYMHQVLTGCWERCHEEGVRLLAQPVVVTDPRTSATRCATSSPRPTSTAHPVLAGDRLRAGAAALEA
jgi:hypothetical protein